MTMIIREKHLATLSIDHLDTPSHTVPHSASRAVYDVILSGQDDRRMRRYTHGYVCVCERETPTLLTFLLSLSHPLSLTLTFTHFSLSLTFSRSLSLLSFTPTLSLAHFQSISPCLYHNFVLCVRDIKSSFYILFLFTF